jgi:hypothetical protein
MVTQHHATFNFVKLALFTVHKDSWIATHSTVACGLHLHGISPSSCMQGACMRSKPVGVALPHPELAFPGVHLERGFVSSQKEILGGSGLMSTGTAETLPIPKPPDPKISLTNTSTPIVSTPVLGRRGNENIAPPVVQSDANEKFVNVVHTLDVLPDRLSLPTKGRPPDTQTSDPDVEDSGTSTGVGASETQVISNATTDELQGTGDGSLSNDQEVAKPVFSSMEQPVLPIAEQATEKWDRSERCRISGICEAETPEKCEAGACATVSFSRSTQPVATVANCDAVVHILRLFDVLQ